MEAMELYGGHEVWLGLKKLEKLGIVGHRVVWHRDYFRVWFMFHIIG